jgi:hypothetical protein
MNSADTRRAVKQLGNVVPTVPLEMATVFARAHRRFAVQVFAIAGISVTFASLLLIAGLSARAAIHQASATTASPADTTKPSAPTHLRAVVSGMEVDLSWSKSSDDVGVVGYTIYRNGTELTTVDGTTTTYADTEVAESTTYSYTVDAFDKAGNHSPESNEASATTGVF